MRKIKIASSNKHLVIPYFLDGENINLVEICAQAPNYIMVSNEQHVLACKHGFIRFVKDGSVSVETLPDKIKSEEKPVVKTVTVPEVKEELNNDTLVIKEVKRASRSRKK